MLRGCSEGKWQPWADDGKVLSQEVAAETEYKGRLEHGARTVPTSKAGNMMLKMAPLLLLLGECH